MAYSGSLYSPCGKLGSWYVESVPVNGTEDIASDDIDDIDASDDGLERGPAVLAAAHSRVPDRSLVCSEWMLSRPSLRETSTGFVMMNPYLDPLSAM